MAHDFSSTEDLKAFDADRQLSSRSSTDVDDGLHRVDESTEFVQVHDGDREEIHRIASRVASHTPDALNRRDTFASLGPDDPALDPSSDKFDAYKWARVMVRQSSQQRIPQHKAGFLFRNLRVTGTGSSLQFQDTVDSVWKTILKPWELIQRGREKVILHQFDGVVKPGELVVVLGRPGSGCSTFLKTIFGETDGLMVDPQSEINYDGTLSLSSFYTDLLR